MVPGLSQGTFLVRDGEAMPGQLPKLLFFFSFFCSYDPGLYAIPLRGHLALENETNAGSFREAKKKKKKKKPLKICIL